MPMLSYQQTYERAMRRRELNERIKQIIVKNLDLDRDPALIADDQPLFGRGLGLDSLDALEIVVSIEEEFGVTIHDDDVAVFGSVNKVADYILAQQDGEQPLPNISIDDAAGASPWLEN